MAEMMLVKSAGGSFRPADIMTEEAMKAFKIGECARVNVTKPRNGKHHRKYWALCQLVAENTDRGWKADDVHYFFKIAAGYYDEIIDAHGTIYKRVHSISFSAMDQIKFNILYTTVIHLVCDKIIPGLDEGELRKELEEITA
jgi:hypothetical protein